MKILGKDKALKGSNISFTVDSAEDPSKIKWYKDGSEIQLMDSEDRRTLNLYDIESPAEGTYWAEYDGVKTNEINLKLVESLVDVEPHRYIHPLPWRDAGFIWIGWWVLDEIDKALDDGFDWTGDPTNDRFKYKDELSTLSWGFENYGDLEVQESRNGYILGRTQLVQ